MPDGLGQPGVGDAGLGLPDLSFAAYQTAALLAGGARQVLFGLSEQQAGEAWVNRFEQNMIRDASQTQGDLPGWATLGPPPAPVGSRWDVNSPEHAAQILTRALIYGVAISAPYVLRPPGINGATSPTGPARTPAAHRPGQQLPQGLANNAPAFGFGGTRTLPVAGGTRAVYTEGPYLPALQGRPPATINEINVNAYLRWAVRNGYDPVASAPNVLRPDPDLNSVLVIRPTMRDAILTRQEQAQLAFMIQDYAAGQQVRSAQAEAAYVRIMFSEPPGARPVTTQQRLQELERIQQAQAFMSQFTEEWQASAWQRQQAPFTETLWFPPRPPQPNPPQGPTSISPSPKPGGDGFWGGEFWAGVYAAYYPDGGGSGGNYGSKFAN